MYRDLKMHYWWPGMKRDIAQYVEQCLICQQIKAEHKRPAGTLQPLPIREWKWERITMDFVTGLPKTVKGYDAIWVIIDRLTKSAHFIPICSTYSMDRYAQLYIQEVVRLHDFQGQWSRYLPLIEFSYNNSYQATIGMAPYEALYGAAMQIRQRMETAQSRQKSYSDQRRRMLEFSVGDRVFLKVTPMKGVMRFGKLRKYVANPSHILTNEPIKLKTNLSYEEIPVEILLREIKKLRNKEIPLVKVLWRSQSVEEATWEIEDEMKAKYPNLFR
ncbi:hypothetical protein DH2020_015775 [Rehmannia glutinosa]|uniref:Integrase zinc-binding domain-containing protein n=1 Tax=Rehmannia glutinosa TaxID=99300 RepID=A0ABR0WV90_REHGL